MTPLPVVVEVQGPQARLRVSWDDGHESRYPLWYLRGFCPCAHCQGHGQGTWTFVPVENPQISTIDEVGNYALSIGFSDGHDTGIYAFEILRELCPCGACRSALGDKHAAYVLSEADAARLFDVAKSA